MRVNRREARVRSRTRLPGSVSATWSGVPPTIDSSRVIVHSEYGAIPATCEAAGSPASHEAAWGAALDALSLASHMFQVLPMVLEKP